MLWGDIHVKTNEYTLAVMIDEKWLWIWRTMGSSIHKDLREEKEWGNVIKIQCQKESTATKEAKWHRQRNPKETEEYQRKHA